MNPQSNQRQTVIVDEQLQRRMVVAAVWPSAASYLVVATSLYVLYTRVTDTAAQTGIVLDGVDSLFAGVFILFVSAAVFSIFYAIRLSHRVAGPLFRFKKTMNQVRGGDLKARARLRDKDLLFSAADDLNEFLDWVEERAGTPDRADTADAEKPEPAAAESTTADNG